jgi:hypothetical protein
MKKMMGLKVAKRENIFRSAVDHDGDGAGNKKEEGAYEHQRKIIGNFSSKAPGVFNAPDIVEGTLYLGKDFDDRIKQDEEPYAGYEPPLHILKQRMGKIHDASNDLFLTLQVFIEQLFQGLF